MVGRGLLLLLLLLLLLGALVFSLLGRIRGQEVEQGITVAEELFDLNSDFSYKYFDLLEKNLLRDTSTFAARSSLLDSVCTKYRDPFRPEHRGLHASWPPMSKFSFFQLHGRDHAMCNILKAGSNSWTVFLERVNKALEGKRGEMGGNMTVGEHCWPDCGGREHLVQVRHPLQRLLSAYRWAH